jgi:hypothetical protein
MCFRYTGCWLNIAFIGTTLLLVHLMYLIPLIKSQVIKYIFRIENQRREILNLNFSFFFENAGELRFFALEREMVVPLH